MGPGTNDDSEACPENVKGGSSITPPRGASPSEDLPGIDGSGAPALAQRIDARSRPLEATDFYNNHDFDTSWPSEFSIRRNIRETNFFEARKELNTKGDELEVFFEDPEANPSRSALEVVGKFCRGVELKDIIKKRGTSGTSRKVWLDERCSISDLEGSGDLEESGEKRQQNNPLTAFGLYNALMMPRYDQEKLPDAARRLIYISDLDPECIYALVATASSHQAPVLGNAIYQHLNLQTSIEVNFPTDGYSTFALALNLPFFLLRDVGPEQTETETNTKPQRIWTDLDFLELEGGDARAQETKRTWGMYEAHMSCVVSGTDDHRWVGYGFFDAEIDGLLHDMSELDLSMDQIAFGSFKADPPVWRPRDYWLKVFEKRIDQVMREWEYLVHKLELGIYKYTKKHSFTLAGRCGIAAEEDAELKEAFDWSVQAVGLVRRIDGVLSNTIQAWTAFSSSDGDIGYFRPTREARISTNARRSLHTIRATFRQLEKTQRKINLLNKCCSEFKKNLQLRLFVEGKETADGNETTSEFIVSVLYPIALVAAIFSMQQQAIPFHPSPRSFIVSSFLMIIIVYTCRLFVRYILSRWSLFRRSVVSRIGTLGSRKSVQVESRLGDEERDALGARVIQGIPAAGFQS